MDRLMNERERIVGTGQPVFAPVHIKGADKIAEVFGVSRGTVVRWVRDGAPIRLIGKKYQASYNRLWEWLLESSKERDI